MKLILKSHSPTIEEVRSGNVPKNIEDYEIPVLDLISKWYSGESYMEFKTSGSTGKPKLIRLTKDQIRHSAEATMNYIDPNAELSHSIVVINPSFIGGAMLVIRSLMRGMDIIIQKPNAIPEFTKGIKPLISLVPYQIIRSLDLDKSYFDSVHTMLIGGAKLPDTYIETLRGRNINAYMTYGMTETASQIALRHVQTFHPEYQIIGDTEISVDDRGCLRLKGVVTKNQWLQTNDVVKIKDSQSFEWIGRADLIINSAGYKINPEPIETFLANTLKKEVLILAEDDEILGQKVILLIESKDKVEVDDMIFQSLHPYSKPKKIKIVKSFVYTSTGKVDRRATAKKYVR